MTSLSLVDWKDAPCCSRSRRKRHGIDEVAVVAERDRSIGAVHDDRLGVAFGAVAGRGVARVADRR